MRSGLAFFTIVFALVGCSRKDEAKPQERPRPAAADAAPPIRLGPSVSSRSWHFVTPLPTPNDLRAIWAAPDGKTVFAAGAGFTVIRSTDGGETWEDLSVFDTPTDPRHDSLGYRAIAGDETTVVIVGDEGMIITSSNLGATWDRVAPSWLEGAGLPDLVDVALSGGTIVAVGDGAIAASEDGGSSWRQLRGEFIDRSGNGTMVEPQRIWRAEGEWLIVGGARFSDGQQRSGLFRGDLETWAFTEVPLDGHDPWDVWSAGPTIIVGAGGAVLRTGDGGATWTSTSVKIDPTSVVQLADGSLVLVGGLGFGRSTDVGATWSVEPRPVDTVRLVAAAGAGTTWFGAGFNGAVIRGTPAGGKQVAPLSPTDLMIFDIWIEGDDVYATAANPLDDYGLIFVSRDLGGTWTGHRTAHRSWARGVWSGSGQVVVVGDGPTLRSTDKGVTWTRTGEAEEGREGGFSAVWGSGLTVIAVGESVGRSTDGGQTWTFGASPEGLRLADVAGAGDVVLAVSDSGDAVFRSPDRGETWSRIGSVREPEAVWVAPGGAVAYIAGEDGLFRWRDETQALEQIPASPTFLKAVGGDSRGTLVAAGFRELVVSRDDGATWERPISTSVRLTKVIATADGDVIAAGEPGAILVGHFEPR